LQAFDTAIEFFPQHGYPSSLGCCSLSKFVVMSPCHSLFINKNILKKSIMLLTLLIRGKGGEKTCTHENIILFAIKHTEKSTLKI